MIKIKRICFFSGDITNSGGTERVGTIIANELSKNEEYQISFVSLVEKRDEPFYELSKSITRHTLFEQPVRGLPNIHRICYRLINLIKKNKFEIIIDIDGILDMYSLTTKLFTRIKVISWEHFNYYQHPVVKHRKYTRWLAGRFADAIVTLTEEDRGYYLENIKVKCPIQAIYNPIMGLENVKEYDTSSKMILSVGRLTHQKGFDMLVDIAKEVLHQHKDWTWIILGEGEDRPLLEQKIKDYQLENRLILKGNVSNIDQYYEKTGIFVLTSRYEGLPMTLLETKPYQLPVVSFDMKTGPKECVIKGENGYLIEEFNQEKMINKINILIENEDLRYEFSRNALNDTKKFSLSKIIQQWSVLLHSM